VDFTLLRFKGRKQVHPIELIFLQTKTITSLLCIDNSNQTPYILITKKKVTEMKSIYKYIDYREYLRDSYLNLKENTDKFSYQNFSDLLNLGDRSFIQNIISGKRKLPLEKIDLVIKGLKIDSIEGDYFTNLVNWANAKNHTIKDDLWNKILKHPSFKNTLNKDSINQLFSHWYTLVIKEVILNLNSLDPQAIQKAIKFPLQLDKISQAITTLLQTGIIFKEGDQFQDEPEVLRVGGNDPILTEIIRDYQKQLIKISCDFLDILPSSSRTVMSATFSLTQEERAEIDLKIKAIFNDIEQFSTNNDLNKTVQQLNIQFFPYQELQHEV
jgi:uncharacterized protein (TIGR02147 family)